MAQRPIKSVKKPMPESGDRMVGIVAKMREMEIGDCCEVPVNKRRSLYASAYFAGIKVMVRTQKDKSGEAHCYFWRTE